MSIDANSDKNIQKEIKDKEERATYRSKLREVNMNLNLIQFPDLPDLVIDNSNTSLIKTIKIISQVLDDRQKNIEQKTELVQRVAKLEGEQILHSDKVEALNQKIKELNGKVDFFKNKLTLQEKKMEKEIDKITKDKEEVQKAFIKVSMKESQYKHEIKKLEGQFEEIKTKLKKYMNDNKEIKITDNKNERILINNNTIIFDNFLKNSPSIILNQVNYSKDFYNLIHKSFNEKSKLLIQENKELRDCFKFLKDELNQYIELKKAILYECCSDNFSKDASVLKNVSNLINKDIFNLDFNSSKNEILQLFNEVIDNFRFLLIYEFYKINPETEFDFEQVKSIVRNNKYDIEKIPYYKAIENTVEKLNLERLEELKKDVEEKLRKDKRKASVDSEIEVNIPDINIPESEVMDRLEDLDNDLDVNLNNMENLFKDAEDDILEEIKALND